MCITSKEIKGTTQPIYINYELKGEISITLHCQLCSRAVKIKNCSLNTFVIKATTMKNTDNFFYVKEAITCYHQIDKYSFQQWNTKEDTGKCMKNALYVLCMWYAKRHLSG